ncbi:MAG: hypothetical protein OQJ81_12210, partial [Melioribacteraceae bacterium]|nr:hypothetical protein [Melioribacteraceae bacterium]
FLILMSVPDMTESLFVWTIKPEINARLIGVMYSNALILVVLGAFQTKWANIRVIMVVITLFSIFATVLTFFYLKPFLAHPWYHLAFWLTMYLVLFFSAPYIFVTHEKKYGGKLSIQIPLNIGAKFVVGISMLICIICGFGLIFKFAVVNQYWPWNLPPLVGGLIGVLFVTHAAAYAWALWDGDWIRVRPMFWQALPTGIMLLLLPLIHSNDLHPDAGFKLTLYLVIVVFSILAHLGIMMGYRAIEKKFSNEI